MRGGAAGRVSGDLEDVLVRCGCALVIDVVQVLGQFGVGHVGGDGQQGRGTLAVRAHVEAAPVGVCPFDGDDAAKDIEAVFLQAGVSW